MYMNAIARMAFGQPQSVVEPLYYMAEMDRDMPDVQNALAVAIYFGQTIRRERANFYADRALARDPANDVFIVVDALTDSRSARIQADGNLVLTEAAATQLHMAAARLEQGDANKRLLAELLRSIELEGGGSYPYRFGQFHRLIANVTILTTIPSKAEFEALETKMEGRIASLQAQALEAKRFAEQGREWFQSLDSRLAGATPSEKAQLQEAVPLKQAEYKEWLELYDQKLAAMNEEYTRLQALLSQDYKTLASLRVQKDSKYSGAAVPLLPPEPGVAGGVVSQDKVSAVERKEAPTGLRRAELGDLGKYYALVIGNNLYGDMPNLRTAIADARAVSDLLEHAYGFRTKVLINASRSELVGALYQLRGAVTRADNLLIYYAGHGYFDEYSQRGYWLPVDADRQNPTNWISNSDITDQIRAIQAKHILVVADSCYSGTLTRTAEIRPPDYDYLKKIKNLRARLVISSGGNEPVADGGPGGHSVFANAFLDTLRSNTGILESTDLFNTVRKSVVGSPRSFQVPNFGILREAEHKGGDFIFVRR